MKTVWLVIANESRTRILEESGKRAGRYLHVVDLLQSQQSHDTDATAGRVASSGHGIECACVDPATCAGSHGASDFAQEVAARLDEGIAAGRCGGLILVAAQPFLARLHKRLGSATRAAVVACQPSDFTRLSDTAIARRIEDIY